MRKRDSLKSEWDTGVSVLMAFKFDHLQPAERILFHNFSTFLTFILGALYFCLAYRDSKILKATYEKYLEKMHGGRAGTGEAHLRMRAWLGGASLRFAASFLLPSFLPSWRVDTWTRRWRRRRARSRKARPSHAEYCIGQYFEWM